MKFYQLSAPDAWPDEHIDPLFYRQEDDGYVWVLKDNGQWELSMLHYNIDEVRAFYCEGAGEPWNLTEVTEEECVYATEG